MDRKAPSIIHPLSYFGETLRSALAVGQANSANLPPPPEPVAPAPNSAEEQIRLLLRRAAEKEIEDKKRLESRREKRARSKKDKKAESLTRGLTKKEADELRAEVNQLKSRNRSLLTYIEELKSNSNLNENSMRYQRVRAVLAAAFQKATDLEKKVSLLEKENKTLRGALNRFYAKELSNGGGMTTFYGGQYSDPET
ncbi:hypothetical protein [Pseudomonas aeruginosa]|uniref:hypothetical protein n=1 Tax=Pseudomonas aeruginosa TaxID=287 RepID=UPI000FFEA1AE|nr:hypothetical protein [Pseudomonas aeruginosa]MBH8258130.1 hypothetical protein [Pseudomonas aeruginosa]NPS39632.1 hypothetical protein [Pseudomonas aeruginosa]NPS89104.1 hypothetical protein [Pseudomonas aeruginosa]HBN8358483.1 hypothetical protein [Pseudomonas aeruginosa]HBN8626545.1 hypothetical protein [Pseudomonas aeruginosa]